MSPDSEGEVLSPDDAFAVLGNETRMEILRTLGEAGAPLSFSELYDRVDVSDSGQFNYHLDKVEGHFVTETDEGYRLEQAGGRIVEAVLTGAVTRDPVIEPTPIDQPCPLCGAETLVAYRDGRVRHYCSECAGHYGDVEAPTADGDATDESADGSAGARPRGYLGSFRLPPAGLRDRTPGEVFRIGAAWGILQLLAVAGGVCPRCSAPLSESVAVCEDHEAGEGGCNRCGNRRAVHLEFDCRNCLYGGVAAFAVALMNDVEVLSLLVDHGINPVSPSAPAAFNAVLMDYEEEVVSTDPFEGRFTFTVDGDALVLTVDEDLAVVAASRA